MISQILITELKAERKQIETEHRHEQTNVPPGKEQQRQADQDPF